MNSSQIYQVCILFVGLHVLALPLFVWAMRRRQFTMADKTVYKVIDDAPDTVTVAPEAYPKWRLRLMLTVLCTAFALMFFTTIVFIHAAYSAPGGAGSGPVKAVCPFGFK